MNNGVLITMADTDQLLKIAATIASTLFFILVLVLNYSSSMPNEGPFRHLFGNYSTGELSDKFYIEITPASWAFSIWGLIYSWQAAWIIYSLSLLCRSNAPDVLSLGYFSFFILSCVANGSWIVVWSWEMIQVSAFLLFSISFLLYGTMASSYLKLRSLDKTANTTRDFWAVQVLVNNGFALYATWCTVASLLNLTMAVSYRHGVKQDVASTISLSILAVEIAVWFALENTVLDKFVRYTLTIYPVIIWALSASIDKNWDPAKRNSIISVVLLAVACTLFVVRVIIVVWRIKKAKRELQPCNISLA